MQWDRLYKTLWAGMWAVTGAIGIDTYAGQHRYFINSDTVDRSPAQRVPLVRQAILQGTGGSPYYLASTRFD
jgi:hypothetical protein